MEPQADRYYKPSGAVPFAGTVLMQLFGAVAAFLLGGLYAAANFYSPSIWLTGFAVLLFGAGVGFAVLLGAKIGKVRNPGFVMLLGTATGILAVYFSWVFYIYLCHAKGPFPAGLWLWSPPEILEKMASFAKTGIWSLKGWMPKGWVLYAFWAAEALTVVILSLVVAVANDTPYCDICNAWTKKEKHAADFALADFAKLKTDLEEDRYEVLDALHAQPKDPRDCLKATLHVCPQCEDSDYLTIHRCHLVTDSDGNESTQETEIVKHLHIHRDLAEHVRGLGCTAVAVEAEPIQDPAPEDEMEV